MAETTARDGARAAWLNRSAAWWLTCAGIVVVFLIRCAAPLLEARNDFAGELQDDAYYYIIPAENLAHGLGSTFDGLSRTNGYHPLWLLIETLLAALGVPGIGAAIGAGLVLNAVGLGLVVWLFRRQPPWFLIIAAGGYFYATNVMATLAGMETDVFAATFLGLLAAIQLSWARPVPVLLGVCAALCILARLDAALFVIPLVAVGAATWRERVVAGAIVLTTLCVYAGVNLAVFGLPLPVSGEVKSLGGLQVNHILLREIMNRLSVGNWPVGRISHWLIDQFFVYAMMTAVAAALFVTLRGGRRYLLAAFVFGLAASMGREVFLSSWLLWPWYFYPLLIGAMILLLVLSEDREWRLGDRRNWAVLALMAPLAAPFLVQGYAGTVVRAWRAVHNDGYGFATGRFYRLNERAAGIMNRIAPGGRVAMGDRAGSFAYHYSGHVVQLEGLMNDAAYYRLLRQDGDAHALLCARGVQYVIAYEADGGDYVSKDVSVVRADLSDYAHYPSLRVLARDQVMKFGDPALYMGAINGDSDDTIYAWRLSGCGRETAAR